MGLRNLCISLNASIDGLITKMVNHEAIADQIIIEVSESAAKLTQESYLLEKQIDTLNLKKDELSKKCETWTQRARESSEKSVALECVALLKQTQEQREQLRDRIAQKERLLTELKSEITKIDAKLNDLKHKKLMLASRESFTKDISSNLEATADDLFSHWETSVLKKERHQGASYINDKTKTSDLEQKFDKQEAQKELEDMLKQIQEDKTGS